VPVSDYVERSPLRALHASLGGGLRAGEVGFVHAHAGVGKSAMLVHLALERLLRGERVLHVAVRDSVQDVRDAYDSALAGARRSPRPLERAQAQLAVEQHRLIHATRGAAPDAAALGALLDTLAGVLEFGPDVVVLDGAEPDAGDLAALRALCAARSFALWVAFTPSRSVPASPGVVELELVPEGQTVCVHVRHGRDGAAVIPPLPLEGRAFRAREQHAEASASPVPLRPADCTMYSGGAHGAEAAFGECAERWGVREVNFTFHGHVQGRTRGAHPLTEEALAAGEVSLAYVSRRLRRAYGEGATIRRVLQSLWHQVSSAQLVFVIGAIQEDGTVTGGTGWSVELARMWNKRLWVFDQEKDGWYRWNVDEWVAGTPVIDARAFCGTGTRYLSETGRVAIAALYERSFGPVGGVEGA
jgi:hypothetical protein